MNGWVDDSGWIHCPTCGNKTRTKIHADTVLKHFPLFCPKCRREHLVDVNRKQIIIVEPDAETQSRLRKGFIFFTITQRKWVIM